MTFDMSFATPLQTALLYFFKKKPFIDRVFIKHRSSENPPATTWNFLAKFHWPVEV